MATKERAGGRLLRFPRRDQVNVSPAGLLGLSGGGGGIPLGRRAGRGGDLWPLCPFGVAAVAAAGSGLSGFCTLAGTCLGYLCLEGLTDGMRYAASAILTYSVAFAFYDTKAYRRVWFMPAIAMLLCALTGIVTRGARGGTGEDMVYFVTEVLFTGVAAYGYRVVFTQWPETLDGLHALSPRQTIGLLLLGGVRCSCPWPGGDFGHLFPWAAWWRRWASCGQPGGGVTGGGLLGACAGVALDLASGEQPLLRSLVFYPGRPALRPVPGPQEGMGSSGLCAGLLRGGAVELGRRPPHGPAPGGAGGGHPLPGAPPSACPRGHPLPPCPPRTQTGRPAARPSPGRWREMAGAFHPLRQREGRPSVQRIETRKTRRRSSPGPPTRFAPGASWGTPAGKKEYQDTRAALNDATQPMLARGPGSGHGFFRDLQQPVRPLPGVFGGGEPPAHGLPAAAAGVAADL